MDFFFDGTSVRSMGLIPSVDGNMDPAEPNITWDEPAYATPIDTSEFVSGHPTYGLQDSNYIELIVADPSKKEELWRWLFSYHGHEVEMASTLREYNGEMARWHGRVSVTDVSPTYETHDVFRVSWERGPWLYYSDGEASADISAEWALGPFGEGTDVLLADGFPEGYGPTDCGWNYTLYEQTVSAQETDFLVAFGIIYPSWYAVFRSYRVSIPRYTDLTSLTFSITAGVTSFTDQDGDALEFSSYRSASEKCASLEEARNAIEDDFAQAQIIDPLIQDTFECDTFDAGATYAMDIPSLASRFGTAYFDYGDTYTYSGGVLTPIIGDNADTFVVDDSDGDEHTVEVGEARAIARVIIINPDGLSYGDFDVVVTDEWTEVYGPDTNGWDGSLNLSIRNNGSVMQLRYQTDNWYPFTFTVAGYDIPEYKDFGIYQYSETLVQVPDCAADALFAEDTFYMTYQDISAVTVVDNRTPMDSSLAVSSAYKVTLRDLTGTYPDSVSVEGTEIVEWDSRLLGEVEVSVPYQPEVFSAIEEEDFPAADMYSDVYRLHENAMDETAPWSGDYVTSEYDGLVWGADMHILTIGEKWPDWEPGMLLEYSDDMDDMNGYKGIYADGFYEKLHAVEVSMTWERADV